MIHQAVALSIRSLGCIALSLACASAFAQAPASGKPAAKAAAKPAARTAGLAHARAPTPAEIRFWHALDGALGEQVEALAQRFNDSQKQWRVVAEYKGPYDKTLEEGLSAQGKGRGPHVLQVVEVATESVRQQSGIYRPLHQLMAEAGERLDGRAFLPAVSAFFADPQGRLAALPFSSSTAVLFINRDVLRKAGAEADKPPATWRDMQVSLLKVQDKEAAPCAYTTSWQSWVHLENLTAWHNEPFASKANGFGGLDARLSFNTQLMIRHVSLMSSWVKSGLFSYYGPRDEAARRFEAGECAFFTGSSASYAELSRKVKFDLAVAPLPHYDEFPGAPYNTVLGGAGLWALVGKPQTDYRGVAKFFAFLTRPDVQAEWHQKTGYLPVTTAAFELTRKNGWYERNPGLLVPIAQMSKRAAPHAKGLRLGDFLAIRSIVDEELEAVWKQQKTPKEALDAAVTRGDLVLSVFERRHRR